MARQARFDKIWSNVDKALAQRGMSLMELAEKSQINYDTIRGWRTKHIYPKVDDARIIAEILSMSIEKVFFDIEIDCVNDELQRKLMEAESELDAIRDILLKKNGDSGTMAV